MLRNCTNYSLHSILSFLNRKFRRLTPPRYYRQGNEDYVRSSASFGPIASGCAVSSRPVYGCIMRQLGAMTLKLKKIASPNST